MTRRLASSSRSERAQASVELVAALPLVLLLGALAWQCVLAGHSLLMTAHAVRSAARAELVGGDPRAAARSVLPRQMERGLAVDSRGGRVGVRAGVPLLAPGRTSPLSVSAGTSLAASK